ncbi:IclR family transcriptional regulator [Halorubrum persicum]|uniref:IclR family transcriptional regulator n=1 Tax=Halorubrum persicum TaxID=1383844 RepID=A0A2G1WME3_9EURY|nr:IclR family transcriptional regulator [Halorubrum persicum]PHQ40174.1 IclR family transcriptional regulator [Halorubrum persicum]
MANTHKTDGGRRIQSVEIALNIIDVLQEEGQSGVTDLARNLDHSKSTIHSHLRTLEDRKLIVKKDAGYRLSLQILSMAENVKNQVGNYDVIKSQVDELVDETGEIVQFGIEEYGKVSYLHKAMGEQSVETVSQVGMRQPMYSTSLGKAILTYLPEDRTEEIIQSMEFEAKTSETITSPTELHEELNRIEENGYAIDDEENINGLRCIATPVRDGETVLGAISITGPSSRVTDERLHGELAEAVQRAANIIELNTKFS